MVKSTKSRSSKHIRSDTKARKQGRHGYAIYNGDDRQAVQPGDSRFHEAIQACTAKSVCERSSKECLAMVRGCAGGRRVQVRGAQGNLHPFARSDARISRNISLIPAGSDVCSDRQRGRYRLPSVCRKTFFPVLPDAGILQRIPEPRQQYAASCEEDGLGQDSEVLSYGRNRNHAHDSRMVRIFVLALPGIRLA